MTPEELAAARLARARRWLQAGTGLHGYPAVPPEQETAETLAAAPPEKAEKKPKPPAGEPLP
jgi:hypothetical protein